MNYSILDAQGKVQATIVAGDLAEACRDWARQCWDETSAEAALLRSSTFELEDGARAAFLDPYLLAPQGREKESLLRQRQERAGDPHFAPEPPQPEADPAVDTGGRG